MGTIFSPPDPTARSAAVLPESVAQAYGLTPSDWGSMSRALDIRGNTERERIVSNHTVEKKKRLDVACNAVGFTPAHFKVTGQNPYETLFTLAAIHRRGVSDESFADHCRSLKLDPEEVRHALDLFEGVNLKYRELTISEDLLQKREQVDQVTDACVDFMISTGITATPMSNSTWYHNCEAFVPYITRILNFVVSQDTSREVSVPGVPEPEAMRPIGAAFMTIEGERGAHDQFFETVRENMRDRMFMFLLITDDSRAIPPHLITEAAREVNNVRDHYDRYFVDSRRFIPFIEGVRPTFDGWLESQGAKLGKKYDSEVVRDYAAVEYVLRSLAQPVPQGRKELLTDDFPPLPCGPVSGLDVHMREVFSDFLFGMTKAALVSIGVKNPLGEIKSAIEEIPAMMRAARQNRPYLVGYSQIEFSKRLPGLSRILLLDIKRPPAQDWMPAETYNQLVDMARHLYSTIYPAEKCVVGGKKPSGVLMHVGDRVTMNDSLVAGSSMSGWGGTEIKVRTLMRAVQGYRNAACNPDQTRAQIDNFSFYSI